MKDVIYIIPSLIQSGPVNVLLNIVSNLNRGKYKPVVVELYKHKLEHRDVSNKFRQLGVPVITYNFSKLQLQFQTRKIAQRLFHDFSKGNTVFHAHGYHPTLILSKMKSYGAHTITTIHNRCDEDFVTRKGFLLGRFMASTFHKALPHISMCVAICKSMSIFYLQKNDSLQISVINNGVNFSNKRGTIEKSALRHEMKIDSETIVLLYPAAISERKNQLYIINEIINSPLEKVLVLFAGMGELMEEYKALANNDKRIRFLGYQNDLTSYWAISDAMISSSKSEGMPMAVLEALSIGKPCLLSNIPPHKEIHDNLGSISCFLFDIKNPGDLTKLLMSANVKYDLPESVRMKAFQLYSSESMTSQYEKLYDEL